MNAFPKMVAVMLLCSAAARAQQPERITFPEAVQRALLRNASVRIAVQEISRAHGIMREVRAAAFPTLSANGLYTRLDADRTTSATVVDPTTTPPTVSSVSRTVQPRDSWTANLQLAVPLVAPQRWVQWEHASEQVDVARLSAEDVRRQIAVTTARFYVAALSQHRLVDANQRAADNAREHLEDAKARLSAGTGNRLDLVRAAQELATSESQVQSALTGLVRAQEALGILVGGDAPVDTTDDMQFPPLPAPAEAIEDAERRRADIQAQRKRAEAAQHVVRDSYADFLPLLTGVAQPFASSFTSLTSPTTGWQAQLVLTLPLYDGGFRYGALEQRRAERDEAREQLDAALRQARSEVRSGFESMQRADASLRQAREASRLAGEALEITTLAYHAGATNDLEVVDAERRARDAANAAAVAEDAARQARIDLLAATGRFP
ncbi:MAG: TolC family protein [Deltaproteobacteria bacterium]|nr:MAG: TolC family protein [Deltaproteobacteria bacterium]